VGGRGTAVTMRLPLSVAVVRALLARVGGETIAIPFTHVEETLAIEDELPEADAPPRIALHERLGTGPAAPRRGSRGGGVTVRARGRRVTLVVDEFVGQQDVVVKRFDVPRGASIAFAGATVLADGAPALIVDVNAIA
jgi:two-component system chemotaxis sensor kinase CheA